jgi:long-chain acyl-CoA synthetase
MSYPDFSETTVTAALRNCARHYEHRVHVVARHHDGQHASAWQSSTWGQQMAEAERLAAAWRALGIKPQQRIALWGRNSSRWIRSAISVLINNVTLVPIYPTVTVEEALFTVDQAQASLLLCDSREMAAQVQAQRSRVPSLKEIVVMDAVDPPANGAFRRYGDVVEWGRSLFEEGRGEAPAESMAKADDVLSIIYTSGTTGIPKGAMLTHANLLSQRALVSIFGLTGDDVFLNHLPLCHSFGLTTDLLSSAAVGATLALSDGFRPDQIRQGLTTFRPTVLMSVPRLFEKIYVEVWSTLTRAPAPAQMLFRQTLAVNQRVYELEAAGEPVPWSLRARQGAGQLLVRAVRSRAGLDRLRLAFAGGGPISADLCLFFRGLGIDIFQGYGLTETSPVAHVNLPGRNKLGTVGPPIEGAAVKVADDGEILLRGPHVMKGYFNNPEATDRAIDHQGWFHTGDIGRLDDEGFLSITDRKKELIITSGGKNIAPLAVEMAFNTESLIERVVAVGEGRPYLVGLVCPDFTMLKSWAAARGIVEPSPAALVARPEVKAVIEERVHEVNRRVARYQQLKKIAILDHDLSEERGELTPTLKVKRRVVAQRYGALIDGLYAPGPVGADA